ncbi:MAG TPA: hemerythrin domain-containing protein [Polyangiaceae bacterium]|jgi:hemerythrin-like domain-containing protein|nr:hemerythrin domain-containing protein [Polyangiaceae bacterium]
MAESIRRLRNDHARFARLFRDLENAVDGGDAGAIQSCWTTFESRLLAHIDTEESDLLPGLERSHPAEVAAIRAEHVRFRSLMAELGLCADLHVLRKSTGDEFLELLRSHSKLEDETLYAWAASTGGAQQVPRDG